MRFCKLKHIRVTRQTSEFVALFFCLFASHSLMAQTTVAIFSQSDDLALRTAKDVQVLLSEQSVNSSVFTDLSEFKGSVQGGDQRLLAIGDKACQQVSVAIKKTDVLCGLISHHYQPGDIGLQRITYLPLEVPAPYFVELAKLLVPNLSNMGVLLGQASHHRANFYQEISQSNGIKPQLCLLDEKANPIKTLDASMRVSDIFMVLPDEVVFNRATAPWVLQLGMRYRIPVLAYSENYVNAGALASLYQSRQDLANNLVSALFERQASLAFSLALNASVARNLGIKLDSVDAYLLALQEAER